MRYRSFNLIGDVLARDQRAHAAPDVVRRAERARLLNLAGVEAQRRDLLDRDAAQLRELLEVGLRLLGQREALERVGAVGEVDPRGELVLVRDRHLERVLLDVLPGPLLAVVLV